MKVLIADFDLFHAMGGGQTFYRSIIEKNPQIEFCYLRTREAASAPRPANARAIPYQVHYLDEDWRRFCDVLPRWSLNAFLRANNIAWSVRGDEFDVVDLPDYEQFGLFLRPALRQHQVAARRIALSLHGRISTTIALNWRTEGELDREIATQEDLQFKTVDLRYGLSRTYLDEWRQVTPLESHYLSPLRFLDPPSPCYAPSTASAPDLAFIGRTEKRKGPDLFVDLAWWLPRASYGRARIIGPQSYDAAGTGSSLNLYTMANNRLGVGQIDLSGAMSRQELRQLFASRTVCVLPSRYDTFNLVAIESLFSGCPTAIGTGAGICRFLNETLPEVPFVSIDVDNVYASLPQLQEVLEDYDGYRARLVAALGAARPTVQGPGLQEIYESASRGDDATQHEMDEWYARLMSQASSPGLLHPTRIKAGAKRLLTKATSPEFRRRLKTLRPRQLLANTRQMLKRRLRTSPLYDRLRMAHVMAHARPLARGYQHMHWSGERTDAQIESKLQTCAQLVGSLRVDRVRLWRELARLESLRENDLVAATYRVRAMRLVGQDRFGDLPVVAEILHTHGYAREAQTVEAMYGHDGDSLHQCQELLRLAARNDEPRPAAPFERLDDRRDGAPPRVSVIVSLYNAADNLSTFLHALALQTLVRRRQAEVVLVDSGSPGAEYAVFCQAMQNLRIPIVYARTSGRETIQAAWNRGIALAKGEYLSFLGVDEGILPDALEVLAAELDADASVDWVQANSLVTNVNERGHWLNDVMTYDRTDYQQPFVYLETCYLSWVGALYRRSIHDRLGMYDASFSAAGDTEFKNRVLPRIKTKIIPRTLGIFWNYPANRTTCSPRAELEDLRAWYLHRSLAGVDYAFSGRDPAEAAQLLYAALRYRKSYCQHYSSDIDYAYNLCQFLRKQDPDSPAVQYAAGVERLLEAYRSLDWIQQPSARSLRRALWRTSRIADEVAAQHRQMNGHLVEPAYRVFNDNRHEQHHLVWPTAA